MLLVKSRPPSTVLSWQRAVVGRTNICSARAIRGPGTAGVEFSSSLAEASLARVHRFELLARPGPVQIIVSVVWSGGEVESHGGQRGEARALNQSPGLPGARMDRPQQLA